LLPLPPLAEQHRIVAKVDELMALCDRLEAAKAMRETTRDRLAAASLARLNAPTPDTFHNDARFALAAFPALTKRPDQIKQLRQTILNLAVRGKLLPQDPNDEPVSVELLRRELDRKQPTGRTGADLGPVTLKEVLVSVPTSWKWSRLFQLCVPDAPIVYGILQPGPNVRPDGVPYVRPSEIESGRIILFDIRHTSREIAKKYSRASIKSGDLILTIVGTIGAVAVVPKELDGGNITQSSCRLRVDSRLINQRFLLQVLRSDCVGDQIGRMKLGTAVPRLNIAHVRAIAVPLPPLAEQDRIVGKVDELMALSDRLEASLASGEDARRRLLDALLADALEYRVAPAIQAA
jgi:type I restriction enzyme S subunit